MLYISGAQHNQHMTAEKADLQKILAARLRALRIEKNLRQEDVARAVNISSRSYSNYERAYRMPDLKMVASLADFFDVSVDYLIGRSDIALDYSEDLLSLLKVAEAIIEYGDNKKNTDSA